MATLTIEDPAKEAVIAQVMAALSITEVGIDAAPASVLAPGRIIPMGEERQVWCEEIDFYGKRAVLVEQSPGRQLLWMRGRINIKTAKTAGIILKTETAAKKSSWYADTITADTFYGAIPFTPYMPWTRLIITSSNAAVAPTALTGARTGRLGAVQRDFHVTSLFNAAHYEKWDGKLPVKGYYHPLPTALKFFSCAAGSTAGSLTGKSTQQIATAGIQAWWGSGFNMHNRKENLSENVFWQHFYLKSLPAAKAKTKVNFNGSEDQCVAQMLEWHKASWDEVKDLSLGTEYDIQFFADYW